MKTISRYSPGMDHGNSTTKTIRELKLWWSGEDMKWFKHISDSLDDPFIFDLMTEFKSDGYVVFFGVIEIYSKFNKFRFGNCNIGQKSTPGKTFTPRQLRECMGLSK